MGQGPWGALRGQGSGQGLQDVEKTVAFIPRIFSPNEAHGGATGDPCGHPAAATRWVQGAPLRRRGWLGDVQGHLGDPRLETRGDPGPDAFAGTVATFGHQQEELKQAGVGVENKEHVWLHRAAGGPASGMAVCDAEGGPLPRDGQPGAERQPVGHLASEGEGAGGLLLAVRAQGRCRDPRGTPQAFVSGATRVGGEKGRLV